MKEIQDVIFNVNDGGFQGFALGYLITGFVWGKNCSVRMIEHSEEESASWIVFEGDFSSKEEALDHIRSYGFFLEVPCINLSSDLVKEARRIKSYL